jgi:Tfp pilus assembly protein PilF
LIPDPLQEQPGMTSVQAIRLGVALAALLSLFGCGSSHSRFETYMASGHRFLAAGNLEKASVEFRNALQIEPRNVDAFYFNGQVAERRGNIREAVDYYQGAVDVQPTDDRARAALAKVYVLAGATQAALQVISPGLLNHPDNPDLLAARAAARHQLKDNGEAREDAERAVKLAPTNENAIAVLSALALRAGDEALAVSLVSGAVTKAPASIDLRRILASVYLATGQPVKAEEQMREVIALEPLEMTPRMQLAGHFVQAHELDEAQRVLEEAVRDLPHRDDVKLALVDFITTQRSREQAEKVLRGFIAREPDNGDLRLGLGMLLQRAGATEEALATYRDLIRSDGYGSKGLAARNRIAAIDIEQGRESEARALIGEVLSWSMRDDDALIMRANLALSHDDPTNAIADLRTVLHDQPHSVALQRSLARAYITKGEPAMAEEALRSAVADSPQDTAVRIELAQFFIQSDRATQAVTLLEEAVRNNPDSAPTHEALVRAYMADHQLSAARTAAEELERLLPGDAQGYYLAGLIAHDEKRLDDSERSLERALELQPGSLDILTSLTRFDLERGHGAAAIARLQRALGRDPANVQLLDLLGTTYRETNDLTRAADVLTKATTVDPRSWVVFSDLAKVRMAAGDTAAAIQVYRTAVKLAPTEPRPATELAVLYEKEGRIDAAVACYETLYKDPRARPIAANNMAMLLVTYRSDRASLDKARELTAGFDGSDNASFLDTLGWVRFKRREYRQAVIALERASDRAPESKVIRYHLGMAQLRNGEREHARTNLESALSGTGNFSGSDEARAALASLKGSRSG